MKYLLIIICMLLATAANCQEKFIEVVVSDTIMVTPNQFVYVISVNTNSIEMDENLDDTIPGNYIKKLKLFNAKQQARFDSLKKEIILKGFTIPANPFAESYNTKEDINIPSLKIIASSVDSVAILYNMIKNSTSFSGRIVKNYSTGEDILHQTLSKKIIAKAKQKAAALAALGNLKLGNILSIKEAPQEAEGWTAYPPLSSLNETATGGMPRRYFIIQENGQYQIESTLVVRFAVQ